MQLSQGVFVDEHIACGFLKGGSVVAAREPFFLRYNFKMIIVNQDSSITYDFAHFQLRMTLDIGLYGAFFFGWAFGAFIGAVSGAMVTYILMRREDPT